MSSQHEPSGCHHCGIRERLHFDRWAGSVGWHAYVPPTDEQIKARMQQRRTEAARTTNDLES